MSLTSIKDNRNLFVTLLNKAIASNLGVSELAECAFLSEPLVMVKVNAPSKEHLVFFSLGDEVFRVDVCNLHVGFLEIEQFDATSAKWAAKTEKAALLFEKLAEHFSEPVLCQS